MRITNIGAVAFALLVFPVLLFAAEPQRSTAGKKLNPHAGKGNCQLCHVETEEALNAWSFFGTAKRKMKMDHNEICRQCHGLEFGHGVGMVPMSNTEGLPLDKDGKITCSLTCHDVHQKEGDPKQLHYHLRLPISKLCESCHK